jgi:hypothetical protein
MDKRTNNAAIFIATFTGLFAAALATAYGQGKRDGVASVVGVVTAIGDDSDPSPDESPESNSDTDDVVPLSPTDTDNESE